MSVRNSFNDDAKLTATPGLPRSTATFVAGIKEDAMLMTNPIIVGES